MNSVLLLCLGSSLVLSVLADFEEEWANHQRRFPRTMTRSGNEGQKRKAIFRKNWDRIQDHNSAEDSSHELKLTVFSDWTEAEFKALRMKRNMKNPGAQSYLKPGTRAPTRAPTAGSVANSWDWRNQGKVTSVKFQGRCGSCWAFGASAAIESMYLIKYNQNMDMSENELMNCVGTNYGRNPTCAEGGWPAWVYKYDIDNGGYAIESQNPYRDQNGQCQRTSQKYGGITGYVGINQRDEQEMKRVVNQIGPISVAVDSTPFDQNYSGWVIDSPNCSTQSVDHVVTIVGYGTENGKDYWLFKNSWDKSWGDQGYGKLRRGVNMCAVAMYANYPVRQ